MQEDASGHLAGPEEPDRTLEAGEEHPPSTASAAKDAVYKMLGSQMRTTLSDGRVVEGNLQCMDRLTNFILADAVETGSKHTVPSKANGGAPNENDAAKISGGSSSQKRHLGLVMIPGKHLVSVQRLGTSRAGANVRDGAPQSTAP